jgi:peptidoglycan/xylan/chitin deacetylase (PgdA/CDA1 family)
MSGIWPGDTQLVTMLTFDVDGVSSWLNRNPGFKDHPSLMSMAEYGPSVAVPRILDLLDDQSIKASFFVPGYVAETHVGLVEEIVRRGHEVGLHGYMHEPAFSLSAEEEEQMLERCSVILQGITGQTPCGYRSPSWDLSTRSLGLLASRGLLYDPSMFGDDAPNFVYAPVAGRLGPMRNPEEVYGSWSAEFDGLYRYGRAFHLTMHPQYIGRPGRLLMLERLITYIRGFPNVEFMRCQEVAELWAGR